MPAPSPSCSRGGPHRSPQSPPPGAVCSLCLSISRASRALLAVASLSPPTLCRAHPFFASPPTPSPAPLPPLAPPPRTARVLPMLPTASSSSREERPSPLLFSLPPRPPFSLPSPSPSPLPPPLALPPLPAVSHEPRRTFSLPLPRSTRGDLLTPPLTLSREPLPLLGYLHLSHEAPRRSSPLMAQPRAQAGSTSPCHGNPGPDHLRWCVWSLTGKPNSVSACRQLTTY